MPAPPSAFQVTTAPWLLMAPGLACGSTSAAEPLSALNRAVAVKKSMQPAMPHPEQDAAAAAKFAALHEKAGKRPNILWLAVDDMGFGDIGGIWDGGAIIDQPTQFKKLTACTVGRVVATFNEAGICPGPMPPCHDGIQI